MNDEKEIPKTTFDWADSFGITFKNTICPYDLKEFNERSQKEFLERQAEQIRMKPIWEKERRKEERIKVLKFLAVLSYCPFIGFVFGSVIGIIAGICMDAIIYVFFVLTQWLDDVMD